MAQLERCRQQIALSLPSFRIPKTAERWQHARGIRHAKLALEAPPDQLARARRLSPSLIFVIHRPPKPRKAEPAGEEEADAKQHIKH